MSKLYTKIKKKNYEKRHPTLMNVNITNTITSHFFFVHLTVLTQLKYKVKTIRIKSPTKANTDLHNGDLKFRFSPCDSALGVFNNAQSSLI